MGNNKKTSTRMRLLAWLMAVAMMCTSISMPVFAEDFSSGDEIIVVQNTDADNTEVFTESGEEDETDVTFESDETESAEKTSAEFAEEENSDIAEEIASDNSSETEMFSDGENEPVFGSSEDGKETPAADAEVFLTLSVKGALASTKDGSVMLDRAVIVKDINKDGKLTYDEALTAAHDAYYDGGASAGYGSEETAYGLSLTRLWGDDSKAYGYWKNDTSCWSLNDDVEDGDSLTAFVYKDAANYSDTYIRFDNASYMVLTDVVCDAALEKAVWDNDAQTYVFQNCSGATLSVYDTAGKPVSEEYYTVSEEGVVFKTPGTYYLAASGSDSANYVPTAAKIKVSKNAMTALKGITLNYETRTVPAEKDDYTILTATLDPADLEKITITWTSSDPEVARVEDGKVYALAPGETVITASAGNVKAECKYKVTLPPTLSSIKCYTDANAYKVGTELQMTPEFKEDQQSGYTVLAPDYLTSLYIEGTIASDYVKEGYNTIFFASQWSNSGYKTDENGVKAYSSVITGNQTKVFANRAYPYQLDIARYTTLKNLVTDGRMQGTFDRQTNTYKILVDNDSSKFAVTPTAYNTAYGITVNGITVKSGEKCEVPYNWDKDGKMKVLVEVSGENMTSSTYTLELEKTDLGPAPVIQEQPKSADYVENATAAALTVDVISNGTLTYQWYANDKNSTEDGTAIANATEKSYVPSTEKKGTYYYYCVITNTEAEKDNTVTTAVASVEVYDDPTPEAVLNNPGSAVPEDGYEYAWDKGYVYKIGETASPLTVTASTKAEDGALSYAWKRISKPYEQSVSSYAPGGDATGTSYTPEIVEANANTTGNYYGCQVTCTYKGKKYTSWAKTGETYTVGEGDSAKTYDVIGVYVFTKTDKAAVPEFTRQPAGGTYEVGTYPSSLYANAKKSDGGTLTYQWYINDTNSTENGTPIEKATKSYYSLGKVTEAGTNYYYCIVTNSNQGHTAFAVSEIAEVIVTDGSAGGDDNEEINLSGKGTKEEPYQIKTAQDYITVAELVDNGVSFAGKYLRQERNITLPKGWTPIGTTKDGSSDIQSGKNLNPFSGKLDGNGKTLTVPEGGLPLLGYVKNAEVSNLNIYGKKIAGYGLVNNYVGVGLSGSAIVIDNVTLKSGSSTLKSGLIGTYTTTNGYAGCSAGFTVTISNCTIEKGVVIGYQKDQSMIGSVAGRFQGNIENCVSHADVYGVDYVGGIAATLDNAMSGVTVKECSFDGNVTASGTYAGGIVGGGYCNSTAPNGHTVTINDCTAAGTIAGADRVGGILGGDGFVAQNWSANTVKGNSFTGKVQSEGTYVGGIIGYYNSLNKNDVIVNNYYSAECGVEKGVGFIKYIDTSYADPTASEGTIYFNTEEGTDNCPEVTGAYWHAQQNRTDDPLGVHAKKLASTNPNQEPEVINLIISGDYATTYYAGEKFDTAGMKVTAEWSNDTSTEVDLKDLTIDDSAMNEKGWKEVKISYQGISVSVNVRVLTSVKVTFSLMGDSQHDSDKDGKLHTLADLNLETWVPETVYYMSPDASVYDVMLKAAEQYGFEMIGDANNQYGTMYIKGITWKNADGSKITLSELDNGPRSGWMDVVNGVHPTVGVDRQTLKNGDVIIFHYTDDYTIEESKIFDQSQAEEITETITALPSIDKLTAEDKEKVQVARDAYEALTDAQKELVSAETLKQLEAAEAKIAELEKKPHVHSFGLWKKVSEATVKVAEVQQRTCSSCGSVEKKSVGSKLTPVLEVPGKLTSISMKKGNTKSLTVTMAKGDSVSSVKSSASKTLKATLDKKTGKITLKALKKGTAKLTIKLTSGKSRTYTVKVVTGTVKTTGLSVTSVNNKKLTLAKGKTHTLKTTLKPFTSTQKVTYKTSNKKVVTVTSKGKIKAVAPGKATVTVTSGSKKVKITVTVPGITNVKSSVSLKKNKTTTLKPKTYGISGKVIYTSSNPKVASVTSNGKIKGLKKGTARITIQAGNYKKTVTVKVK